MTISSDDIIECLKRDINELADRYESVVQQLMEKKEELECLKAQYERAQRYVDHEELVKRTEYVAWNRVCTECKKDDKWCPYQTHRDCPTYQTLYNQLIQDANGRL